MAQIEAGTVKGSVFDADDFTSYNDPSRFGECVPTDHQVEFTNGEAHTKGIDGGWSQAR